MKTFKDLEFKPHQYMISLDLGDERGVQARIDFDNGYGASVVCGPHTYGGKQGLYELAVFHDGDITYDTPITDDVKGWLTEDDVTELLKQIQEL